MWQFYAKVRKRKKTKNIPFFENSERRGGKKKVRTKFARGEPGGWEDRFGV